MIGTTNIGLTYRPTNTLGSRIIVPRDKFMEWIDEQAAKKSEIF